ncbi:PAS domain S-box protein [Methanogenium sp. S4BF]|uniref:response regulator n=1 Tax=Methanogenium sp. S4BF TaxID=1789226 RepID=UPI0024166FA1|nr:PAS domain S-box protein [Methanogenium sp. S4BF]WFN34072.1 PAS domain S-box protein [Methanogenium sp. S4BF]
MELPQASDAPISVLYVDDEYALLEIGKIFLERAEGIRVTTVDNTEDAIRLLVDGAFDAIVSDYQMPGMDGIAFLKYIRSTYGSLPFLLFTGKGREEVVIEALNNGADYYVEKAGAPEPQFADLVHKIRRAVSRCRIEQILCSTYAELQSSYEQLAAFEAELKLREESIAAMQQALRESEQIYQGIFDHTGSATAIFEEDMTISLANTAFAELTGFSREEIEGRMKWSRFVHPDELARLTEYHWSRRRDPGSAPKHYDIRFVDRFGKEHIIYMTTGLIPGTSRSVASHTDITELKETRDRLTLLGNILDDSRNEIYIFDAGTLRFVQVNRGGRENIGYSMEELSTLTPVDLKPECTDESFWALLSPLLDGTEDLVSFTTKHRRKDGSEYPVEVHLHLSRVVTPPVFVAVIIDITSRREVEEENRILRHMVDHASSSITVHDYDGRFIYANECTIAMHGYSRDEFMALRLEDLDVPASAALIEKRFQEVREEGESIFEAERYRKDGSILPVLVHLSVAQWGEQTVLLSIAEDITEWKEIEHALRESRKQLSFALEAANDGLWDWNIPKGQAFFSPQYLRMLGYEPDEFATTYDAWWEYVHPDDRADAQSAILESIATKDDFSREIRMRKKDGSYLWILARGRVMETDSEGQPLRMVGTHTDISRQKQVEEALQESRKQFSFALDAANEGLWDWNMVSDAAEVSSQYLRLLGYGPGEFAGNRSAWSEYVHPNDRDGVESAIQEAIARDGLYSHEFRMRKKDGTYAWFLARGRVMERDDTGRPLRMVGTHIDISGRRQIEEALRLANRKLQLLSGITRHDILNQAMALNGYICLTEEMNPDPAIRKYLQKMHKAAFLIEQTIAFTREYEQLGKNEPKWLSVQNAVVNIAMTADLPVTVCCEGVEVFADPLITTVFSNMMDNIIRHAGGATEVIVSCVPEESGGFTIVWEDDGVGIPDALKERIFDRGHGSNTGLGLFLVREILAITGIAIRECGIEGKGARFELLVPPGGWRTEEGA